MPPPGRDVELVARANRGDATAMGELYERHRRFVFRLAYRRMGNVDDALDVLQDTFIRLFARFPGFELTSPMVNFLYPVVIYLCRDRRERQRPTVDIDALDAAEELALSISERVDDSANLLSGLMPAQRELLTLRFIDDLSLPQLAEKLGAPVGTIKSRLHRAIGALRAKMTKE